MKKHQKYIRLILIMIITLFVANFLAAGENASFIRDEEINTTVDLKSATYVDLDKIQDAYLIDQSRTYVLSGTLQGSLTVLVAKNDALNLIMNGAHIINSKGTAIEVQRAQSVTLTLAQGTENTLKSDGGKTKDQKDDKAVIEVKNDLTINGTGSLDISTNTGHGIYCQGNLRIDSGNITITSQKDGIRSKESVHIRGGLISIGAGADGIVTIGKIEGQGNVQVGGGDIIITAGQDGIQAQGSLSIAAGIFDIFTGMGGTQVHFIGDDSSSEPQKMFSSLPERQSTLLAADNLDTDGGNSKKGLKSDASVLILGGIFKLNTQDDAISSKGDIFIDGGDFSILTGDDGISAQEHLHIKSGMIDIVGCNEGLESKNITIDSGSITIIASDDGINAANPQGKRIQYEQEIWIVINGGTIKVVAGYDAIDTNGTLTITGGTVDLTIKYFDKANAAIDTDGGYFFVGGQVTTNDGSENTYQMKRP